METTFPVVDRRTKKQAGDTEEDRRMQEEIRAKAGRSLAVLEKSFLRVSGRYVILSPHRTR